MSKQKDYYDVMGLARDASEKDIKLAYRRLARKYHPDINKETDAEEKFKELGQAYDVLGSPEKRKAYDQYGHAGPQAQAGQAGNPFYTHSQQGTGAPDMEMDEDLFASLFGFGRQGRQRKRPGEDYHANISLTLEEAYQGATRQVEIPIPQMDARGETVVKHQTLQVKIPAGITAGHKIRLLQQGGPGIHGGPRGNLYLTVHFHKHRLYEVKEKDIYLTLPVAPWEAALGGAVKVPTLAGVVDLKIPEGSQSGQQLRLKGRGLPGKHAGDQFVVLKVVLPPASDAAAKKLYEEMKQTIHFNPREKFGIGS